jgi:hypothetical protein
VKATNHPLVAKTMEEYSALLRATGRSVEADEMAKRAREIRQPGQYANAIRTAGMIGAIFLVIDRSTVSAPLLPRP